MSISGSVWTPIGPSPIVRAGNGRQDNGLTSAIAINPNNPNIIYQGTAGGGVWRTMDGGTTWTPIFDRQISLGVGGPAALVIDPNDTSIIYVGTTGRWTQHPSAGLFKSTDGGASFIRLGSGYPADNTGTATILFNDNINVVIVDPANSQRLFAATNNGVFRSIDGGLNWTMGTNSAGDIRSLVLDTTSTPGARILYAGKTNGGGAAGGVFQSRDDGQTWTSIFNAATPSLASAVNALNDPVFVPNFGKVLVGLAPPISPPAVGGVQVLYASVDSRWLNPLAPPPPPPLPARPASAPIALFVSIDQGATWTQQPSNGLQNAGSSQGGYSFQMAVDPASPGDGVNDIIYLGGQRQVRTSNSGTNFTQISAGIHADTHCWAFISQPAGTPTTVLCGNDGGIFRSDDQGASWTALNGGGLQTSLFYNLDVRRDASASVTIGTLQDNGILTTAGVPVPQWSARGGDGWDAVYDGGTASSRVYGTAGFFSPEPCTRAFRSDADATDIPSASPITPWTAAGGDAGCYLASIATDPNNAGVVYIAGDQNLWQSVDSGATWVNLGAFAPFNNPDDPLPAQGRLSARPAVAPSNGNNVVVAFGGASAANRVSVSTNALNTLVPAAPPVTFTDITRNLPTRSVLRAAFDPNDPTVIYAVLGGLSTISGQGPGQSGHVFRTTIGGTEWDDISPDLDVPFGALALDGTDTPTSIYVGTDLGVLRSVDDGATWSVLDDIHFPGAPVTDLIIGGSGTMRAATYGRGVFEFAQPNGPVIAVNLENSFGFFEFGTVCEGPAHLTLQIFNVGTANLVIHSVQRLLGATAFMVEPFPATPLVIAAGEHIDFTIRYIPTTPGEADEATIRIRSNDPGAPNLDIQVTGTGGVATAVVAVADNGDFGEVCLNSFVDRDLVINNSGKCRLEISAITSSSLAFIVPGVVSFPLVVSSGGSINLPLRFQPTVFGAADATIRVSSNDPESPAEIRLRGSAPAPELDLIVANTGNFGDVCIGSFMDQPLTLLNSGPCTLTVTNVISASNEFVVPNVLAYPIRIAPGAAVEMPIRFEPASFGAKVGTITVISDDPTGAKIIAVSGNVPSGKLTVTGSTCIGGVKACCLGERTISICNVGDCKLHVTRVAFKRKSKHWKLINNPFPATLHPGSCLSVLIRYKATEKCPRCCELVITSDDPDTPVKTLDVMAYTVWDSCGCKKCCEDCHNGCCEKSQHSGHCSLQSLDACCDEEGQECEDGDES